MPEDMITQPMDTFFIYRKPVPSPYLVNGQLSESAQRERNLFYTAEKVNCIQCHETPLFCNASTYTIVNDPFDADEMNTPSLKEYWRSGPYGHLGSVATVRGMLDIATHSNVREQIAAGKLTEQDVDDLVASVP